MPIRCPLRPEHWMVEISTGLHQCSHCGYGPSQQGYRPYWAISNIEITDDVIEAVSIRFDERIDCYVMTGVTWRIDPGGHKIPRSFVEACAVILSTKEEMDAAALPVVIRAKGKWDYPPAKPALKEGMFTSALGPKEISLSSAQRDMS